MFHTSLPGWKHLASGGTVSTGPQPLGFLLGFWNWQVDCKLPWLFPPEKVMWPTKGLPFILMSTMTSVLTIWMWRNHRATRRKYGGVYFKQRGGGGDAAAAPWWVSLHWGPPRFSMTFGFLRHFYQGWCMCSEMRWVWRNPRFWEWKEMFLDDGDKCLCLRAGAATSSSWQGVGPAAGWMDGCSSTERLRLESYRCWKPFHQPLAHNHRKWLVFWRETGKNLKEKCKYRAAGLDGSKRGRNSTSDFYLFRVSPKC